MVIRPDMLNDSIAYNLGEDVQKNLPPFCLLLYLV
jgi:hypothetical protein